MGQPRGQQIERGVADPALVGQQRGAVAVRRQGQGGAGDQPGFGAVRQAKRGQGGRFGPGRRARRSAAKPPVSRAASMALCSASRSAAKLAPGSARTGTQSQIRPGLQARAVRQVRAPDRPFRCPQAARPAARRRRGHRRGHAVGQGNRAQCRLARPGGGGRQAADRAGRPVQARARHIGSWRA